MTGFIDNAIAIRVAALLVSDYKTWDACKSGIISEKGEFLREPKTEAERDSWTALHRMVWRLRQLLAKLPGGDSKLAQLGTTYFLMRESNYEPMLDELEQQILDIIEETGIGAVAGANVGPDEGLGTTNKGKIIRRKTYKEYTAKLDDGVNE